MSDETSRASSRRGARIRKPRDVWTTLFLLGISLVILHIVIQFTAYGLSVDDGLRSRSERQQRELAAALTMGDYAHAKRLIERGMDPSMPLERNVTPLHLVAEAGENEMLIFLLDRGADVNAVDVDNNTPVFGACWAGHLETVRLLIEHGADLNCRAKLGYTPLRWAMQDCDRKEFNQKLRVMELLLKNGADINLPDDDGYTPLHQTAVINDTAMAKFLLEHGAKIDARDNTGGTPLIVAVGNDRIDMVKLLLSKGADVNTATTKDGRTAMHWAALGSPAMLKLLLAHNAKVNVRNHKGVTPLGLALQYCDNDNARIPEAHGGQQ